jgi:ketosteroid isomerase-like protein
MLQAKRWKTLASGVAASIAAGGCMAADIQADRKSVYDLDVQYQAAVERNDAATIERIHHPNMTLVLSNGTVVPGTQIEQRAREKNWNFEQQVVVDDSRTVRVMNDTAVVTAKLWLKGTRPNGELFDYKVWFSDTYVRTPTGWRYFFGQAGAPLPK